MRRELRARRLALSAAQRSAASQALVKTLAGRGEFRNAQYLAVYMAMDGEIDPSALVTLARNAGKQLYLPVLATGTPDTLHFARWQPDTPLYPNRFKIPEPRPAPDQLRDPAELDLVLTPLVAFDEQGHRLGMGGGFYDRSFAFLKTGARKPLLVGLAYEFQRLPSLAAASWDVPLAGVATEHGFHRFPG